MGGFKLLTYQYGSIRMHLIVYRKDQLIFSIAHTDNGSQDQGFGSGSFLGFIEDEVFRRNDGIRCNLNTPASDL